MSRLDIPGTFNFREVAPGHLCPGTLYRSEGLDHLGEAGREALKALGIRLVIDLRSDLDIQIGGPDDLDGVGAEYLRYPILSAGLNLDQASLNLRSIYRTILSEYGSEIEQAIGAIATAPGPTVVHCTAGKDRTGLVVALTLAALGIDRDAIVNDYEQSTANLAGPWSDRLFARLREHGVELSDQLIEVLALSPASALIDAFSWVESEYGGVLPYLASIGIDDTVIQQLRGRLLEDRA